MRNAQKNRRETKLRNSFKSAKTTVEMLKVFKKMEDSWFQDKDLIFELISLANELKGFPEKVLFFGKRALTVLIEHENNNLPCFGLGFSALDNFLFNGTSTTTTHPSNHSPGFLISTVLILLGDASLELKRYDECVSYFNWANRNFTRLLEHHGSSPNTSVLTLLASAQILLVKVKDIMGKKDEVVVHLRKVMEVKEKYLEEGCMELCEGNRRIYEAYVEVRDFKQALPFCLKVLEIYQKHKGLGSKEVAAIMRGLAFLYDNLGEYEKALEHNLLSQCVLKNVNPVLSDSLKVENGNLLIKLGRYEEAVSVLKALVLDGGATDGGRASACVSLAKAFLNLKNFADAKKYLEKVDEFLLNKKLDFFVLISTTHAMFKLNEMVNDLKTALSKRRSDLEADTRKNVVDGLKGLGASEQEYLDEALETLNQMKKRLAGSGVMVSNEEVSKDGENLCETISKCGISDDKDLGKKKI